MNCNLRRVSMQLKFYPRPAFYCKFIWFNKSLENKSKFGPRRVRPYLRINFVSFCLKTHKSRNVWAVVVAIVAISWQQKRKASYKKFEFSLALPLQEARKLWSTPPLPCRRSYLWEVARGRMDCWLKPTTDRSDNDLTQSPKWKTFQLH